MIDPNDYVYHAVPPNPRPGFLVMSTQFLLDDGSKTTRYFEVDEETFMDENGILKTEEAIEEREEALASMGSGVPITGPVDIHETMPAMQINGEEASPGLATPPTPPTPHEIAERQLMALAEALAAGKLAGMVLIGIPLEGPVDICDNIPLVPGHYERTLGMLTRLTVHLSMAQAR